MDKMEKIKREKIDLCIKHSSCRDCPRNARCEREYQDIEKVKKWQGKETMKKK